MLTDRIANVRKMNLAFIAEQSTADSGRIVPHSELLRGNGIWRALRKGPGSREGKLTSSRVKTSFRKYSLSSFPFSCFPPPPFCRLSLPISYPWNSREKTKAAAAFRPSCFLFSASLFRPGACKSFAEKYLHLKSFPCKYLQPSLPT